MLAETVERFGRRLPGLACSAELDAPRVWADEVAPRIRSALNASAWTSSNQHCHALEGDSGELVLVAPNSLTCEWIDIHFGNLLRAAASDATDGRLPVRVVADLPTRAPRDLHRPSVMRRVRLPRVAPRSRERRSSGSSRTVASRDGPRRNSDDDPDPPDVAAPREREVAA